MDAVRNGKKPAVEMASAWSPFAHRAFALLWVATLISNIGTWMHDVGAGWLMTTLNPSPAIVVLVQAATTAPIFLFALFAGALADRVDRRRFLLLVNLVVAGGILVWAIARYPGPLDGISVAAYGALLLAGMYLNYTLNFLFLLPVFWMHQGAGLREVYFNLSRYAERPDGIFTGWVRRVLTSVLPFALIISFPTRALFGEPLGPLLLQVGVAILCSSLLLWVIWRRGLRAYASASS
jgi:ABC-type uncharacterized transport system permease subunit